MDSNKKRTQIFYEHYGDTITFGFDETFEGVIAGERFKCKVLREKNSLDVVIVDHQGNKLLQIIINN